MALLEAEAKKLSNNDLVRGVIEEIIDVDQTFQLLPFVKTEGKAYVYNRENSLASAQFIKVSVDVPESATTFTEVSVTLRIIAGDVDVDNFMQATYSDTNDQKSVQVAFKAKAMQRLWSDKFINGVSSTAYDLTALGGGGAETNVEFDGMDTLATQVVFANGATAGNGAAFNIDRLDVLIDTVRTGMDAFVFSRRALRDYKKTLRALSAVTPEYITLANGSTALAYAGKPILMNDFISDAKTVGTSTDCTTIYAAKMNEVDGLHGVFSGPSAGFQVIDIGQLEKRDATRTRIKWYCALALKSTKSLAKLTGVRPSA